jgi:radical SAM protein with 4Fe4S-binding SPASM domain
MGKAINIEPRKNETTAVLKRHFFEIMPDNLSENESRNWIEFREKYDRAHNLLFNDSPAQIDFELNSRCNLKCPFCTHGHGQVENKTICFSEFAKIIDEAVSIGVYSIKLNYINEPLLNMDLERFISYAKEKGIVNIYMATNGVMLTKERGRKLIESGITKIFISIDAFSSETYLKMRLSKHYDKIIQNINDFFETRKSLNLQFPLVRVNFLKSKENIHELENFVEYWKNIADTVGVQDMIHLPNSENNEQILEAEKRKDFKCSFPFKMLVVDSDKNILPCCTFHGRSLALGNTETMTLQEAWNSKKMKDLQDMHQKGEYWKNEFCKKCVIGGDNQI